MSNQYSNDDAFIISDSLADRFTHWNESAKDKPDCSLESQSINEANYVEFNNCIVTHDEIEYIYPLLGWDMRENRVDLDVPAEYLWMFVETNNLDLVFFEKKMRPIATCAQFLENLWRVSVYFDDI